MFDVLGMILAGGRGARLSPLTRDRAKPAVPFGGRYRIIDFVLSNFINSGFSHIKVLTQYRSNSLLIHLSRGFNFGSLTEHYVDAIPAHQAMEGNEGWYLGTADAIYRNLRIIEDEQPADVAIFGADHIYKMDIRQMLAFHRSTGADCTVAAIPAERRSAAGEFGILEVDESSRIVGFEEKPQEPKPIPGRPEETLVSMGNYLFKADVLHELLTRDSENPSSRHDFGGDVIPSMIGSYGVFAYDFNMNVVPGESEDQRGYWRDVGTLDSFFEANMDLHSVTPRLNLYNYDWPIRTATLNYPPTKFVFNEEGRRGSAFDSIVAAGAVVSGATVCNSVLFNNVFLHSGSTVDECLIMHDANIGRGVSLQRTICDKGVTIEDGTVIGKDLEADRKRFTVSPGGVVVIPKGATVPCSGPLIPRAGYDTGNAMRPRAHKPGPVIVARRS
jgi:glucose-1-phosphate adenylyltransferase